MPFTVPAPPPRTSAPPLLSPRGATLATRIWKPSNGVAIRALCLLVPGGGWHSGYFEGLTGRLNRDGIFCVSYDHVNMGYSDNEPGAPAGYQHVKEASYYVEDLFHAALWAQKRSSRRLPLFLLGESFGGLIVLAAALDTELQERHGIQLTGVVTLGALIQAAPGLFPPSPIIRILELMAPCCPLMKMPATDFSSTFDQAFGHPEWAKTAREDPKVQVSPHPTLGGAVAILGTCKRVAQSAKDMKIPLLAIHAQKDCRADFQAVQKFVDQAGTRAEGFWITDTTGHLLLQDHREVTERVKNKIAEWICATAP